MREDWELSLAAAYQARRDYLRAATFMYEAFTTRACNDRRYNPNDFDRRRDAYHEAREQQPAVRQLEHLRNALAHGVRPRSNQDTRTLDDENRLRSKLEMLRKDLFKL
jgi:hypothetical protein